MENSLVEPAMHHFEEQNYKNKWSDLTNTDRAQNSDFISKRYQM